MQNHFARLKAGRHQKLQTPLEGVVYGQVPEDRLVVINDILEGVRGYFAAHPQEGKYDQKATVRAVVNLAERGFLKEVYGGRIERLLEG